MSDEATSKSGKTWLCVVGLMVGLPVCYVLSVGPAAVLLKRAIVSREVFETVYSPVLWFGEKTDTRNALESYAYAWLRLTGTPPF